MAPHSDGHPHPLQPRHHQAHCQRRPQRLRVRVLLAGQHGPAGIHHQADRGQDEPGTRRQRSGRAGHSAGRGQHPLLLVPAAQPLQIRAEAESGIQYRGAERPPAHPAHARTSQNRTRPHLRRSTGRGDRRPLPPHRARRKGRHGRHPPLRRHPQGRPLRAAHHPVIRNGEHDLCQQVRSRLHRQELQEDGRGPAPHRFGQLRLRRLYLPQPRHDGRDSPREEPQGAAEHPVCRPVGIVPLPHQPQPHQPLALLARHVPHCRVPETHHVEHAPGCGCPPTDYLRSHRQVPQDEEPGRGGRLQARWPSSTTW